jgi:hypothetical protein
MSSHLAIGTEILEIKLVDRDDKSLMIHRETKVDACVVAHCYNPSTQEAEASRSGGRKIRSSRPAWAKE